MSTFVIKLSTIWIMEDLVCLEAFSNIRKRFEGFEKFEKFEMFAASPHAAQPNASAAAHLPILHFYTANPTCI
jgi:hypothetical protein